MKFSICNVKDWFKEEDKEYKEKLEKIGFKFKLITETEGFKSTYKWELIKGIEKEFNTIQELVDFTNEYGDCIIEGNYIQIYDDFLE